MGFWITDAKKDVSRKGAKGAKVRKNKQEFFFGCLVSWSDKDFEIVWLNIS